MSVYMCASKIMHVCDVFMNGCAFPNFCNFFQAILQADHITQPLKEECCTTFHSKDEELRDTSVILKL